MSTIRVNTIQHTTANSGNMVLHANGNVSMLTANSTLFIGNTSISNAGISVSGSAVNTLTPGMRNRIINGDMRIDQRNAGASLTPSNQAYTVDRWYAGLTQSSKFSVQQNAGSVTPPAGFSNYLGVTSLSNYSTTTNDTFYVGQKIEGYNLADLAYGTSAAKSLTLSFWVYSSITGTFGGSLHNAANTRSYLFSYTISSANTWTYITITIPGDTASSLAGTTNASLIVWFGLGSNINYSSTAGSWLSGTYVQPTSTVSVVGTSSATFYLTGVQLEVGTVATPFEFRQYGQELALCQRYYHKSYDLSTVPGTATTTGAIYVNPTGNYNGACSTAIACPVEMRTNPTVTFYSPTSGASGKAGTLGSSDYTAQGGGGTRNINMSTTSAGATTTQMTYHYTASSEL